MDRPRLPHDKLVKMLYEDGTFLIVVRALNSRFEERLDSIVISFPQVCWGEMSRDSS